MRFIHLFLTGYFLLVVGIVLALWQMNMLKNIAPIWIVVGVLMAVGTGFMMSVSSGKPSISEEIEK